MHLTRMKKNDQRSGTQRKSLAGDIITEMILISRRHRVQITGKSKHG